MKKILAALSLIALTVGAAKAQVTAMPRDVQDVLAAVGPIWGNDIPGNIQRTLEVYTPILRDAPKDGVRVTRDVAYGPDATQRFDLFQPERRTDVPIVVFVHGGAYVRGTRNVNEEVYGNITTYFARMGMLGVNAGYRLAPAAPWPAGAEDLRAIVEWLKSNGQRYAADTNKIYLIGHSAGATHVASYAFDTSLQPDTGAGIAGIVLMSGRYRVSPEADDPNFDNVRAYFGAEAGQYPQRSSINHIQGAEHIPTFVVIAEYDNPDLDVLGSELFAALCERDSACPRFMRLVGHNHLSTVYQFNTADDALGREIVEFIQNGR